MLFSKVTALLSLALSSVVSAQNFPGPRACNGPCFARDPAVVKRDDGTYFRFSTKDRIGIATSKNMAGPWTQVGSVIQGQSSIDLPGRDDLWAPEVKKVGNTYYCFYSVSELGSRRSAIGYATSPNMAPGSWTDRGAIVQSTADTPFNAIDPNLYRGPGENEWFLAWGSYWQNIFSQRVTFQDNGVVQRTGDWQQIAWLPRDNHPQEGAFVWKRDGFYYLFMSRGKAGNFQNPETMPATEAYHVVVCRSQNPRGPFVGKAGADCMTGGGHTVYATSGNIFAPGGQGIFHDPAHGDIFYYHYFNRNVGYENRDERFGWNVLNWVDGWPVVV